MLTNDITKPATLADYLPVKMPELTPLEWLSMLPGVVAQLEPEGHEEFMIKLLRLLDKHNIEMANCVLDECAVGRTWK